VFDAITADVKTVAGLVDVSRQVVDRGIPATDSVIFGDLVRAYNANFDTAALNSAVANYLGLLNVTGLNTITYTDATPTVGELYPKIADAVRQIAEGVFLPGNAIFMAPRRWAWFLAALDTQNRPLVVPQPQGPNNAMGAVGPPTAEGAVGSIMGVNVYITANMPLTLGAGANEDRIVIVRRSELMLFEDNRGPYLERFDDIGSANLTVRFRLHNYVAQCNMRRPKAISVISGTGLVPPTW